MGYSAEELEAVAMCLLTGANKAELGPADKMAVMCLAHSALKRALWIKVLRFANCKEDGLT